MLLWTLALCFHSLGPELGLLTKPVPLQTRLSREPWRTCIRILIREPDQSDSSQTSQSAGRQTSALLLVLREWNQRLLSQAARLSQGLRFESRSATELLASSDWRLGLPGGTTAFDPATRPSLTDWG